MKKKIQTEKVAVSILDLGYLLKSIAELSNKENSNEDALNCFLECFENLFQKVLRVKKILRVSDGKSEFFQIFETQDDCDDYLADYLFHAIRNNHGVRDDSLIIKRISFEKFAKLTKGKYMNFSLYSIESEGTLLFKQENWQPFI